VTGGGVESYGGGYLLGLAAEAPEPGTMTLFALSGLALFGVRWMIKRE
jgi:hypothetical protein